MKQIKNLRKAANRILRAADSDERIILYGDADMDGVTSVIILKEALMSLGKEVAQIYFPDREKEGYGFTEKALACLKKYAPALIIVLDCGISNFEEIKKAKEMGFEIIVVDHHEPLDELPEASIIVDPKQEKDEHPFKYYANVGLAFELAKILLGEKMTSSLERSFLELAAMATIADMVPRDDKNEEIINKGLKTVESSWRPGLQALFDLEPFEDLSLSMKIDKINSITNVRRGKDGMPDSYKILVCPNKKKADGIARRLYKKSLERKEEVANMVEEVEERLFGKGTDPLVFEGSADWELALMGVAASRLVKKFEKPVFLYQKKNGQIQGSIRAPSGFNVVEAMKKCSSHLLTYGGHPQAAGFRTKEEEAEKFKKCLFDYFS